MRSGLITQKVGMTRVFKDDGSHLPVTVLKVEDLQVVANRTNDTDGYVAVQLGYGKAKVKNVSKPMRGHFAKAKVEPKAKLAEFRVSEGGLIEVGAELSATHFVDGQYVDVIGTSIGMVERAVKSPATPSWIASGFNISHPSAVRTSIGWKRAL